MPDIGDSELNSILDELLANPKVLGLVLFGSRSRGTHRPDSDVDLLLVLPERDRTLEVLHPVAPGCGVRFDVWLRSRQEIQLISQAPNDDNFVLEAIRTGILLKDSGEELAQLQTGLQQTQARNNPNINLTRFCLTHALDGFTNASDDPYRQLLYHMELVTCIYSHASITGAKPKSLKELIDLIHQQNPELYQLLLESCSAQSAAQQVSALRRVQENVLHCIGGHVRSDEFIATGDSTSSPEQQCRLGLELWQELLSAKDSK